MTSNSGGGDPPSTAPPLTATTKSTAVTSPPVPSSTRPILTPPPLQHPIPPPRRPPQFLHHHQPASGVFGPPPPPPPTTFQLGGKPSDSIRYPIASSGRARGNYPTPQLLELSNSSNYARFSDGFNNTHLVRGSLLQISHAHLSSPSSVPVSAPPPPRGGLLNNVPLPKAGASPYSALDSNAAKDSVDKGADNALVTLRDRKVRISEGASLYALCRSWLRNGYVEENQLQYGDVLKSLPKPLPLPLPEFSPKRKHSDDETEVDEVEKLGEIPNAEELLRRHVKRAKKVRARLREERLQRIERYKSRLALLLPPNGAMHE